MSYRLTLKRPEDIPPSTPDVGPGPAGGGAIPLNEVTVVLTDAQIQALPTTPVVIVPATEVLDYVGIPTQLPVPLVAMVRANVWADGYGNIDGADGSRFGLYFSNEVGGPKATMGVFNSDLNSTSGGMFYVLGPPGISQAEGENIEGHLNNLFEAMQDNALVFCAPNGGLGNFAPGDPANTLTVTVLYYLLTL